LAETNSSGTTLNEYIFFNVNRIARRDPSGNVYYYFQDQLGTTKNLTTSAGVVCYDADFLPLGGEMAYTTTCAQNYKFTGLERDGETGNDHTLHRMYESSLGRWLSPDPLAGDITNPQSLNRYAYVLNNATSLTDPTGLTPPGDCNNAPPPTCNPEQYAQSNLSGLGGSIYGSGLGITGWGLGGLVELSNWQTFSGDENGDPYSYQELVTSYAFIDTSSSTNSGLTFGLRVPGQTFKGCMAQNAKNYSAGGALDLALGLNNVGTSDLGQFLAGNQFGGLWAAFAGSASDAGSSMAGAAPGIIQAGIGTGLTYGRRTAAIMSLNLPGNGGLSQALSSASTGVRSFFSSMSRALSLGLSAVQKAALDAGLFGAEAVGCLSSR
jgi:RHS repeat-associated protein